MMFSTDINQNHSYPPQPKSRHSSKKKKNGFVHLLIVSGWGSKNPVQQLENEPGQKSCATGIFDPKNIPAQKQLVGGVKRNKAWSAVSALESAYFGVAVSRRMVAIGDLRRNLV